MTPAPMRVASEDVEQQGTISQHACGGDDDGWPREAPRHAEGLRATKPRHPDLRQARRDTDAHTTGAAKRGTARNTASRHPANRAKATGKRTQAGTPHHDTGTAPRGSHREHRDAPKRMANQRGFANNGDVQTIVTSETERKAEGHRDIQDDGLCM